MNTILTLLLVFISAPVVSGAGLLSLSVSPSNLNEGGTTTLTATLHAPAGEGGQRIDLLYSSTANLSTHAVSFTVGPGETTGTATVAAASSLSANTIVTITGTDGTNSVSTNLALNKAYAPRYPIKLCWTTPTSSGTCNDSEYQRATVPIVDRILTHRTSVRHSVKDPGPTSAARFSQTQGINDYYLLWFDTSLIPAGSTINGATLQLRTYTWYTTGDSIAVRRITDPDSLSAGCPSCSVTGWSTLGTPDVTLQRTGATAAFRNHTGDNTGTKWRLADAAEEVDQLPNSLAPADDTQTVSAPDVIHSWNVTSSLQAWVNGAGPNQGWALYSTSVGTNGSMYPIHNPGNRTQLLLEFTPPEGSDITPPTTITDLDVSCEALDCSLRWTAPIDDAAVSGYDIRYSNSPITDDNFSSATSITSAPIVASVPAPGAAGDEQSLSLALTPGFTFYFAMRSRDAAVNWSPTSNTPSITTTNTRGVLTSHPRMLLNDTVADTWKPNSSKLAALLDRVRSGSAATDLATLRTLADNAEHMNCAHNANGQTTRCTGGLFYSDNAAFLGFAVPAFFYQVYKGLGDMTSANAYADFVVDKGILDPIACWNASGDCNVGTDAVALGAEGAAVAADWVWPRIIERGVRTQVITSLKSIFQTRFTNAEFASSLRESDFHNYSVGWWSAWLACGLVLQGEDPEAAALLDKAWGIMAEGYPMVTSEAGDVFTFNLKQSIAQLSDGAMNWEGPQYWRSAVPEIVRAIEEYDTATGRSNNIWPLDFPTTYRAGLYKIYVQQPDGTFPGIGDATTGNIAAGRDNYGMVVLLDRFKDRPEAKYFKTYIDSVGSWDAGEGGELGLLFKLIFYPYSNLEAKPFTDLPLADKFGNDTIVRTGWKASDSFFVFQSGYSGMYHRGMEQGSFHLYGGGAPLLLKGGPYAASSGDYYHNYLRRTVAANGGLLIYDSSECWTEYTGRCSFANDGGQRWPWRRYNPPFNTWEFYINRLWSATILDKPGEVNYQELFNVAPSRLSSGQGFAYIHSDLTKAYANQYSIDPDSPAPPDTNHNTNKRVSSVTRDVVVFTKTGDVVMFDRVGATRSSFKKKLVLHTINAPIVGSVQSQAGDTSFTNQTRFTADSGSGRIFANVLLPASPALRVVGGNTCPVIPITSITSSNPVVVTTGVPHGLTTGETIGITFDTIYSDWGNISAAAGGSSYFYLAADVIDPVTFRIKHSNGTYFSTAGYPQPAPNPRLVWHEKCSYEAIVDDFPDPLDSTGRTRIKKNLWVPQATFSQFPYSPKFRVEIEPSTQQADDNFLMVYRPSSNVIAAGPASSLIDSGEFYGAITDGNEIAVFSKPVTSLRGGSYEAQHSGSATHVVSGLLPNMEYRVVRNSTMIGTFGSGAGGVISFEENVGGVFTISSSRRGNVSGRQAIEGAVVLR